MAGYVCTIAGGKGGVGKTTTALNVAAVLEAAGYDTVVVDADLGMANLGQMLGIDHDSSIHEILAGQATVDDALTETRGDVTVIPGEQTLEAFADADPANLREVITALREAYDAVLVDTGAGLSHETMVPLGLADGILLVTTPDDVAVSDTAKTADLADRVDGRVLGGLVCRVTGETDVAAITAAFDFPTLGVVPVDHDATGSEPLVLHAPDSPAAEAYELLGSTLADVFFEGADPAAGDLVFEASWFEDETDEEDDEEDDDSGGRFGLFG
ncbi:MULTISPECIES: MinD/ParA family ATP-binding protein [Salinibaculum]|uniref:MinD/ParA family ATP-binding protein n=1 Tax=Salinibaculum TaxID=2732368 RepID=UPI0030CD0547